MRQMVTRSAPRWSYRARIVAATIIAIGVVGGGLVLATIPDAAGVIHGCYTKSGGAVRVIDSETTGCKSGETAISWSVQGPAGPTGAAGPTGSTGARGPSDAFLADQRGSFGAQSLDPANYKNFVKLSLPAGSYVVNGSAALAGGATFVPVQCTFRGSVTAALGETFQGEVGGTANSFAVIAMTTAFTLTGPEDVSIACRGSNTVLSQPSTITAVQVAALTDQSQ